jgi:hypothetical protein
MGLYIACIILYIVFANIFGLTFFLVGRKKVQFLTIEYFFIYIPLFAYLALMASFSESLNASLNAPALNFVYVVQAVGSGVMGGLVLVPRLIFVPQSTEGKLLVISVSAIAVSAFHYFLRLLLLSVITSL